MQEERKAMSTAADNQANRIREDPPGKRSSKPSAWKDLGALGLKIAVIAVIAVLVFTFVYGLHYNVEPGMAPAIKDGDMVVYYRWDKDYRAGDLVLLTFQGQKQVRRVIAAAGDKVDITGDGLLINGALQQEREIYYQTRRYAEGIEFPIIVGEGEIFVLGDTREDVTDSRIYGAVNIADTQGTVIVIFRRRSL